MIYKIQSKFLNLEKTIKKLSKYYDVIFYNNVLYAGLISLKQDIKINTLLKPSSSFYVVELDEDNLKFEADNIIGWCKEKLVNLDMQKIETEEQDKLKNILNIIDKFEENLLEEINKEGGSKI